ncbi:hypothetical protein HDU97_002849 [Phlyctochytrium planicorne]|nr:hypothetical protein HDU97_002849 [Phlyctochytrium planicorne]
MGKRTRTGKGFSKEEKDLPPAKNYKLENDPVPKAFQRVMRMRDEVIGRSNGTLQKEKKKPVVSAIAAKKAGESFKEFNQRLNDSVRNAVNAAAKAQTKTAIKKKAILKERKKKLAERRRKGKKKEDDEDKMDGHATLFGTQASAPPTLTVKPKKIGGSRQIKVQQLEEEEDGANEQQNQKRESVADPAEVGDKVGRKTKLRDLPLSQQRLLSEERTKAIEHYRTARLRRANINQSI